MATPPLNLRPTTPPGSPSASDFSYETATALYLFTSLTAGSSHIITATSRLETILKANRVPFKAVDCATDEKARRLWSRRAGKKKLPGLVKQGVILADLEMVEEWNELGEIKDNLGGGAPPAQAAPGLAQPSAAGAATLSENQSSLAASAVSADTSSKSIDASAPAPAATSTQTAQQQQQALLAREAAALGAQRSKPKPIPSAQPATAPAASSTTTPPGPALSPPRSPELDQDYNIDDAKHNTSSTAALPPLSIRTNNASPDAADPARSRADTAASLASLDMPAAPPPTAVDAHPATSIAGAIPEASAEDEAGDNDNDTEEDEGPTTPHSPPAGSEAGDDDEGQGDDDDDNDNDDAAIGRAQAAEGSVGQGADDDDKRSPRILEGDPSKHISFREEEAADRDVQSPRILEGDSNKHISFED